MILYNVSIIYIIHELTIKTLIDRKLNSFWFVAQNCIKSNFYICNTKPLSCSVVFNLKWKELRKSGRTPHAVKRQPEKYLLIM